MTRYHFNFHEILHIAVAGISSILLAGVLFLVGQARVPKEKQCQHKVILYQRMSVEFDSSARRRVYKTYDQTFINEDNAVTRANELLLEQINNPDPMMDSVWVKIEDECPE